MPKYIDADALIKRIFPCDVVDKKCYTINAKAIYEEIQKAPTADVVPMAEVEQLKHKYDLAAAEREANVKGFTAEIAELQSEIKVLKDSNINLQELYQTEREKVAKAKQKVIDIAKALKTAKSEAIKEFAERLAEVKQPRTCIYDSDYVPTVTMQQVYNLANEMTEEKK